MPPVVAVFASMSSTLTIQGRDLSTDDIEVVRKLIDDHPGWHRTWLSKHLCQLWNWRTETGLLKDVTKWECTPFQTPFSTFLKN